MGDALTNYPGQTPWLGTSGADIPTEPRTDQEVICPFDRPMYPAGPTLGILKGNPSHRGGAVAKLTGR